VLQSELTRNTDWGVAFSSLELCIIGVLGWGFLFDSLLEAGFSIIWEEVWVLIRARSTMYSFLELCD